MKIVLLGGYGEMGRVAAADLSDTAGRFEVIVAGRDGKKAMEFARSMKHKNITGAGADSSNKEEMDRVLESASVLINATNYYSNLDVMQSCLRNGVNYVDLGGMYHTSLKQMKLGSSFRKRGLVAVIGCGATPGITNLMALKGSEQFEKIDSIDIAFADWDKTDYGMPFVVPYSMYTVFDEFTSKPAVFSNGSMHFAEPLSGRKMVRFPKPVGRYACYYSLHSELASLPAAFAGKGVRNVSFRGGWSGDFIKLTKFLIDAGFASEAKERFRSGSAVPRDVAVKLLNRFIPGKDVRINDLEYLKVELSGYRNGKKRSMAMYCRAVTNRKWNIPAGSWDTGVPPSIAAQMIARGMVHKTGVLPPEAALEPDAFFMELARRNMSVYAGR